MITLEDRFWSKVGKENGPVHPEFGRCWVWIAARIPNGYGSFGCNGNSQVGSHRVSWELANGPILGDLQVRHRCDNKSCVRPTHLLLGTHDDNMADRDASGLTPRGSSHGNSKLTEERVAEMRQRYSSGETVPELTADFRMDRSVVRRIVKGQTWRHVV